MKLPFKPLVAQQASLMREVSTFIADHPELGYEEQRCSDYLTGKLSAMGLEVEQPLMGASTAFRATLRGKGPRVGWVLLYDAVPSVRPDGSYAPNHSCGHNLIAGAVVGATAYLAQVCKGQGELVVMGLPGDEIAAPQVSHRGGGKALSALAGVWDDVDAVFYIHPEFSNNVPQASRWMERFELTFSHPRHLRQRGQLEGAVMWVLQEFLAQVRQLEERHSQEFVMVQGGWVKGDVEAYCALHAHLTVLLCGMTRAELKRRAQELKRAAQGLAKRSNLAIDLTSTGMPYTGILPNPTLTSLVHQVFEELGLEVLFHPPPLPFATDFGNITRRAPGVLVGVGRTAGWSFHAPEGVEEFRSESAQQVMVVMGEVLARATIQLWKNPSLVREIQAEFKSTTKENGEEK